MTRKKRQGARETPRGDGAKPTSALPEYLLPFLEESVCVYSKEGHLTARLGAPGGLLGQDLQLGASAFENVHPDDVAAGIEMGAAMDGSEPGWQGTVTVRLLHATRGYRPYRVRIFNLLDNPQIAGFVVGVREVGAPEEAAATDGFVLDGTTTSLADVIPTASLVLDRRGRIRHATSAAAELLGRSAADLLDIEVSSLAVDLEALTLQGAVAALCAHPGEETIVFNYERATDALIIEATIASSDTGGHDSVITVMLTDRTDEPELVRRATRDPLTGLANRALVAETLAGLLVPEDPLVSVLFLDLDGFKAVNDRHGHSEGDRVLQDVARQLTELVRPGDLVGRFGGDEFVVLCRGLSEDLSQHVSAVLRREVRVRVGDDMLVRVTIGLAGARSGDTVATILGRADQRMLHEKRSMKLLSSGTF